MGPIGRPDREQLSSLLQTVLSPRPRSIHLKSMEDNHVAELASSSVSGDMGHNTSLASPSHSRDSPLVPPSTSSTAPSLISPISQISPKITQSKDPRSNRSCSIHYGAPNDVTDQVVSSPRFPSRSKSCDGNPSQSNNIASQRQKRFHGVDEALSFQQATPFIDVSHSIPPPISSTLRTSIRHSRRPKSQQQRRSIDLGYNMMQASLRRLKRSPSLWTTNDRSLVIHDAPYDRQIHNLRTEPQLSDQQKLVALRRARKIAQVFGSEAPIDVVHGNGYIHHHSTDRRDSMSTIGSRRRRSNSDSSVLAETSQNPSTSRDEPKSSSDMASDIEETSLPFFPSSSFSERRRRAAKLTHFFGVNYQDISQSIGKKLLSSTPQQRCFGANDMNDPAVEVDVKVVGRRFWGMSGGQTKTADVADVIGKLRGLKAG